MATKYTYEDKYRAAMHYLLNGSINKTSKMTGIPRKTLGDWTKTQEWGQIMAHVQERHSKKMDAEFNKILKLSMGELQDRLKNGDRVVAKDGQIVFKPVTARDAAWITGVIFDKKQIQAGKPTSISGKTIDKKNLLAGLKEIGDNEAKARKEREDKIVEEVLNGDEQDDRAGFSHN